MKATLWGNSVGFDVFIIKEERKKKTKLLYILIRSKMVVREAIKKTIEINKIEKTLKPHK